MNRDELNDLIDALLDGRATEAQQRRLQEMLQSDAEAQAQYLRYVNLHSCLRMTALGTVDTGEPNDRGASSPPTMEAGTSIRSAPARWRVRIWAAVTGVAAALLLTVWAGMHQRPQPSEPDYSARVVEAHGQLEVVAADGTAQPAAAGTEIARGQTLRSGDTTSAALVERAGDPIELGANTFISFAGAPAEEVHVAEGGVHFQASRQPLVVRTPHAEIRADKATLSLVVTRGSTRVSVHGGTAQLIRTVDNQLLEVPSDAWVIVDRDRAPLAARPYVPVQPFAIIPTRGAVDAALSPDGMMVAVTTARPTSKLEVYDVASRQLRMTLGETRPRLTGLAFSPDGAVLAMGGKDPFLELWDLERRAVKRTIQVARADEEAVTPTFSAGGNFLAALSHIPWNLRGVNVWRLGDGEATPAPARARKFKSLVALPGTDSFVAGTDNGDLVCWNARTGEEEATYRSGQKKPVKHLAVSGDGRWLAHPASDGILVWDVATRQVKHQLGDTGHLAFSADGRWLAAASFGYIDLWNVETGERVTTLPTEKDAMIWLAFAPDGKTLLTLSGSSKRILIWRVPAEG